MKTGLILLFLFICKGLCSLDFTGLVNDKSRSSCRFPLAFHSFSEKIVNQSHHANLTLNFTFQHILKKEHLGDKKLYKIRRSLGSGTFGDVYKAIHLPTWDRVALKLISDFEEEEISREVSILKHLKDAPNFLPLRDIFVDKDDGELMIGLVLDYFQAEKFKMIYPRFTAYQVKVMIFKTIKTLEYAHSKGVMHRDIKPLNVLMKPETLEVKVIDWGQSDYYIPGKNFSLYVSTWFYKPPEMLLSYQKYDYAVDVWSTGCMLAEMAFKKYSFFEPDRRMFPEKRNQSWNESRKVSMRGQLDAYARVFGTKSLRAYAEKFKDDMDLDVLKYVGEYKGEPLTNFITLRNADMLDPMLIDLLYKMLVFDHTKRITMKEALKHPYFDEVRGRYEFVKTESF